VVGDDRDVNRAEVDEPHPVQGKSGPPAQEGGIAERKQRGEQLTALGDLGERVGVDATMAPDEPPLLDQADKLPVTEAALSELLDAEHRVLPTPERGHLAPLLGAFLSLEVNNLPSIAFDRRQRGSLGTFLTLRINNLPSIRGGGLRDGVVGGHTTSVARRNAPNVTSVCRFRRRLRRRRSRRPRQR
jgi:hypothetical protein